MEAGLENGFMPDLPKKEVSNGPRCYITIFVVKYKFQKAASPPPPKKINIYICLLDDFV